MEEKIEKITLEVENLLKSEKIVDITISTEVTGEIIFNSNLTRIIS